MEDVPPKQNRGQDFRTLPSDYSDSADALVDALMETGQWTRDQIEVHVVPQHLYGYKGDRRQEVANIIVRRKIVGHYSNDLGFIQGTDGNYEAIVSDYDSSKYGKAWHGKLKGNYAYHSVRKEMEPHGRTIHRERCENGHQRVVVTGYR